MFGLLEKKSSLQCYAVCLETIRILSREKSGLDTMTTENALQVLVRHAGLELSMDDNMAAINIQDADSKGEWTALLIRGEGVG